MRLKQGFTLIELLVVVAIIGILASVVLASLTSARSKGKDSAVFAQLSNMRAQAELYYSTNKNYGVGYTDLLVATNPNGVDITPTTTAVLCDTLYAGSPGGIFTTTGEGGLASLISGACASGGTAITASVDDDPALKWALSATGATPNSFYCVDSVGDSKSYTSLPTLVAATCP